MVSRGRFELELCRTTLHAAALLPLLLAWGQTVQHRSMENHGDMKLTGGLKQTGMQAADFDGDGVHDLRGREDRGIEPCGN